MDPRSYYIKDYVHQDVIHMFIDELANIGVDTNLIHRQLKEFFAYEEIYYKKVEKLQEYLKENGFYSGNIDGMLSPDTREAINAFLEYLETTDVRKLAVVEIDNMVDDIGDLAGATEEVLSGVHDMSQKLSKQPTGGNKELEKTLQNFDNKGKAFEVGAKTFKAIGNTAQALSVIGEVTKDFKDDGKAGIKTVKEVTKQVGSIIGGALGAKAGKSLGAKIVEALGESVGAAGAVYFGVPAKAGKEIGGKVLVGVFTIGGSIIGSIFGEKSSGKILDELIDISQN